MNVYNPVIPYCGPIQVGLSPGTIIKIQGSTHPSPRCFAINLQCGPSVNPRDDLALHLSPVFTPPPRVVRNSLQSQRWGPEESHGGFPFYAGQGFEILILIESDHFKIAINVDGDVTIGLINFEVSTKPSYSMPSAPPLTAPYLTGSAPPMTAPYPAGPAPPMTAPYPAGPAPPMTAPYPAGPAPYPSMPGAYAPTQPYPAQAPGYPSQSAYPAPGYPTTAYPHSPKSHSKGILGGALGGTLGGLAAGAAASSVGSALLGRHHKHSSPIPIGGLAAGAGAAALGAAVLTGHHPFKKAKKLFKHKGFKHKWHKPKFGKWKHKGWSSGSSSSEEE